MELRYVIRFKSGPTTVAEVPGIRTVDGDRVTVQDLQQIIPTEQLLEKLTGLRVHIEQVN